MPTHECDDVVERTPEEQREYEIQRRAYDIIENAMQTALDGLQDDATEDHKALGGRRRPYRRTNDP